MASGTGAVWFPEWIHIPLGETDSPRADGDTSIKMADASTAKGSDLTPQHHTVGLARLVVSG